MEDRALVFCLFLLFLFAMFVLGLIYELLINHKKEKKERNHETTNDSDNTQI
jgi:hypothetical protein